MAAIGLAFEHQPKRGDICLAKRGEFFMATDKSKPN